MHGPVLVDGMVRATWRIDRDGSTGSARLVVTHLGPPSKRTAAAITAEGRRMLKVFAADAESRDVQVVPLA